MRRFSKALRQAAAAHHHSQAHHPPWRRQLPIFCITFLASLGILYSGQSMMSAQYSEPSGMQANLMDEFDWPFSANKGDMHLKRQSAVFGGHWPDSETDATWLAKGHVVIEHRRFRKKLLKNLTKGDFYFCRIYRQRAMSSLRSLTTWGTEVYPNRKRRKRRRGGLLDFFGNATMSMLNGNGSSTSEGLWSLDGNSTPLAVLNVSSKPGRLRRFYGNATTAPASLNLSSSSSSSSISSKSPQAAQQVKETARTSTTTAAVVLTHGRRRRGVASPQRAPPTKAAPQKS